MHKTARSLTSNLRESKMRTFILIRREIEDHIAYFMAALILSAVLVALCISAGLRVNGTDDGDDLIALEAGLAIPVAILVVISITAMGTSQMYNDKNQRISAFLSTLPTTRAQIFAARLIAGLLAILVLLLPAMIAAHILVQIFAPPIPIFAGIARDVSLTILLTLTGCYCLGLQTGWTSGRIAPTLAALVLACILIPLMIIKGFGSPAVVLLLLFVLASLARTWCKFSTASL